MEKFLKIAAGVATTAVLGYVSYRVIKTASANNEKAPSQSPKKPDAVKCEPTVSPQPQRAVSVTRDTEVPRSRLTLPVASVHPSKHGALKDVNYKLLNQHTFMLLFAKAKDVLELTAEVHGSRLSVQRAMNGRLHTVYSEGGKVHYLRPVGMRNECTSYEAITDDKLVFFAIARMLDGLPASPSHSYSGSEFKNTIR